MNILTKIETLKNLSPNEMTLADYILKHPRQITVMNTKELSQKCFVSTSTIYRLCEKLSLSGFSDLKVKISDSLHSYLPEDDQFDFNFPVKQYQTHYEITQKIKEDYEKTIISTQNLFDLDQIRLIIHAMKKADVIDIYTSAGNIFFAENFKFQMKEIGIDVNVPIEEYHQRLYAASSSSKHIAIVIHFEGRGLVFDSLMKILKKTQTPIVLISSHEIRLDDLKPDYQLYISNYENHYNKISSYSTRLSILYILDVLYTCYFELDYKYNLDKKLDFYKKINDTNPNLKK